MEAGAPGEAPESNTSRACSAVSVPSRLAPVRSQISHSGAGVPNRKSSRRVSTSRTGRLCITAIAAASGSNRTIFPPNPPPTVMGTTRTWCCGIPSASAVSLRT